MLLHLDPSSGVPVYLRLEAQVTWLPGLPSTRKLAAQLRINPNTVAREGPRTGRCDPQRAGWRNVCRGWTARPAEQREGEAAAAARAAAGSRGAAIAADARRDFEAAGRRAR